ncbi:MAG: NAD(P)-dependent glycerol-1-phosphate dehydrogenase [Candidatus Bathyarchaeia archaeon]
MKDSPGNRYKNVHRINLPRIVLVGKGVIDSLGKIVEELGYTRALMVTGETTYKIAGARTGEVLEASGIASSNTKVYDATLHTVEGVCNDIQEMDADIVLGIGGGRNIDVAKLASSKTKNRFISVPTVASHDGIASNLASIKDTDKPYSVEAEPPIAVVMDSKIISEAPYKFTASGCGDVISKVTEIEDWKLAHKDNEDYYGAYAGSLSLMSSTLVMDHAEDIRARTDDGIRTLLEALVSCGVAMSIAGTSRPCSGSSHLFSHALDQIAKNPALHGEQCGVGAIMMSQLHGLYWKRVRDKLETIGAPTTADQLGIDDEVIIQALVKAKSIRPDRYTILSKIEMDRKRAETLARKTGVI